MPWRWSDRYRPAVVPAAGGIPPVEAFEDVSELVRWDALAVIGDVDERGGRPLSVDADPDLPHEPIIEPATWEIVQAELARRSGKGTASTHPFATRIKCADCGGWYGRKVWHSTSKYRRHIWRCNNKYKPGYHCTTPHVTGQQIKEAFTQALTKRVKDNATLDHVIQLLDDTVYDTTELETRQTKIAKKMEETMALINQLITENATTAHDPDEYDQRYQQLEQRYQQQEKEHQTITNKIADLTTRQTQAKEIRDYLACQPPLEYSDQAWNTLVKQAAVDTDGTINIIFKDQA